MKTMIGQMATLTDNNILTIKSSQMKTRNLKTIIAFAQSRGMMAMSVVEVIKALNNMRRYKCPKTTIQEVAYPKMEMSWIEMRDFLKLVIQRKNALRLLFESFGAYCSVVIGGSLSLKYQMRQFSNRGFHDIDLIIRASNVENHFKLRKAIVMLMNAGGCKSSSKYYPTQACSYEMGSIEFQGKTFPVNIIIGEINKSPKGNGVFNTPNEVFEAKMKYITLAHCSCGKLREKDLIDLYKITR